MKLIGLVLRGARYPDDILEVGDLAIHGEEAFPVETLAERVGSMSMAGDAGSRVAEPVGAEPDGSSPGRAIPSGESGPS